MKKLWQLIGRVVYWVAWPGLYIMLRNSHRTRVLIVCGQKVLLVKTWLGSGRWGLPGGGVEKGENTLQTAVREVSEEVGVELQPDSLVHLFDKEYVSKNKFRFSYSAYGVELEDVQSIKLEPEIIEAAWFNIDDIQGRSGMSEVIVDTLKAWRQHRSKV